MPAFSLRTIRTFALIALFAVALGLTSVVSAQQTAPVTALQGTPTPIDSTNPVKLEFGKPFEAALNNDDRTVAFFQFKGKANQLVNVTVDKVSGSYGFIARTVTQNDVDLMLLSGDFAESLSGVVKLPQDGNYRLIVSSGKPGAGDFEEGAIRVTVDEAKKATPVATATK